MAKVAITEQYLTDIADAIRNKTGLSSTFLPAEMAPAILTISGSGGITPTGTISITTNGTYNVTQYASASVTVPTGSTISNQNKSVTPTKAQQQVTYDNGYTGLGIVTVNAIPANYIIPTGNKEITENGTDIDVTEFATVSVDVPTGSTINNQNKTVSPSTSQQTVTFDSGYTGLGTVTVNAMPTGTTGMPSASKGTVSNHSISVTPSVTNTTGYIIGSTKTGTAVTVSASELVSGTLSVTSNGTKDVTNYASISVNVSGDAPVLQDKSYTVSGAGTSTITPDNGYDAMSSVALTVPSAVVRVGLGEEYSTVSGQRKWNASPQAYAETAGWFNSFSPVTDTIVYNAVPANTTITPSTSAQTIGGANYHMEGAVTVAAMPTGTAGTPTATKGIVSNHSISVTPSVTNTTGYITGSTKTGTAVTVSASELVSGSETKTSNGTYDVTNLAELVVNVSGDSPTIQSLSITPSETEQTFNASSVDGYKPVSVSAISSTYVGSGISRRSSTDLTVSGATVTAPAGYYAEAASKSVSSMTLPTSAASSATSGYTSKATIGRSTAAQYINIPPGYNSAGAYYVISAVANGSATAPASISGTAASVSTGTNTLTLTKTVSVTPTVSAGYVSAGTAGNSSVSLTASVTTKAAATITPTTTNQTIAAGTYLTGTQTIAGDADLVGSNILSTANIFGVQGTVDFVDVYIRSAAPTSSVGNDGDIYIQE